MPDLIDRYIALLKEYNEHTNIYSKKAYDKLDFHIQDCITLANLIGNQTISVVDFGSGSGLPSIIIAISNPNNQVVAVESKSRKSVFCRRLLKSLTFLILQLLTKIYMSGLVQLSNLLM
jgi:16S rRNA (guanine527-N7)-methyltransferase